MRGTGRKSSTSRTRTGHLYALADAAGTVGPWDLTEEQIVAWLAASDLMPWSLRSYTISVVLFYRWALKSGRIQVNPVEDLAIPPPPRPRPRPTPDSVLESALEGSPERTQLMIRCASELGMRCNEVALIHSDDLVRDLFDWSLLVHGKGDRQRTLPLPPILSIMIRRRVEERGGGWLFPGAVDGHLSARWIGKLVAQALPGNWTMHTLRHRFSTRAYAASKDLLLVQELLGHSSPETTRGYIAIPPDDARDLINRLARTV